MLDLVCSLIAPIGDYRRAHRARCPGKKRKRAATAAPDISLHILTGLNVITRYLERHAAAAATATAPANPLPKAALILLTHPNPSLSPAHAHIPTLLHLATLHPQQPPAIPATPLAANTATRLVPLATTADARLASKLAIPRVGALAILDSAPGASALLALARERVGLTECAWVEEAMSGEWRGVHVEAKAAAAGVV